MSGMLSVFSENQALINLQGLLDSSVLTLYNS